VKPILKRTILLVISGTFVFYFFYPFSDPDSEYNEESIPSVSFPEAEKTAVFNIKNKIIYLDSASEKPEIPGNDHDIHSWYARRSMNFSADLYQAFIFDGMPFRMAYPYSYTGKGGKYPAIFVLHSQKETGGVYDNETQLINGGKEHLDAIRKKQFNGFVIYPQIAGAWYEHHYDKLDRLIHILSDSLGLDVNRILVQGLSDGAKGAIQFASKYPQAVAGTMLMHPSGGWGDTVNLAKMPMWVVLAGRSKVPARAWVEYEIGRLTYSGTPVKYTVYENYEDEICKKVHRESEYFAFARKIHKANPVIHPLKTVFSKNEPVHLTLSLTSGFNKYQWRRNGVIIPGRQTNTLQVTSIGKYDARILRSSDWSEWSPDPVIVHYDK